MSSTLVKVEQTSKKRKHEDDAKKPKKKHKPRENLTETGGEVGQDIAPRSIKKEKKHKKDRDQDIEENQKPESDLDSKDTKTKSKKEKKKQKRKEPKPEPDIEPEKIGLVADDEQEEEMTDVPPAEAENEETIVEGNTVASNGITEQTTIDQLQSSAETAFHAVRMSLYLPIPAHGASNALSAMLAVHLAPLLLTYFPPVEGVVLSYHDPVLSARPQSGPSKPLIPPATGDTPVSAPEETLSRIGDEFVANWVWLTVTFLVFKPTRGDELQGWINAKSEGFIGMVSYNYFQSSISKHRVPKTWSWSGPSCQKQKQRKLARKGKLNDNEEPSQESQLDSQETAAAREDDAIDGVGTFVDERGATVPDALKFKVVDLEMIPAQERGLRFALQLEGSLLDEEAENELRAEEEQKWENRMARSKSRSRLGMPLMSGGLSTHSRAGSVISTP